MTDLTEIWKAVKDEDHPFKINLPKLNADERITRGQANGYIKIEARSNITKNFH